MAQGAYQESAGHRGAQSAGHAGAQSAGHAGAQSAGHPQGAVDAPSEAVAAAAAPADGDTLGGARQPRGAAGVAAASFNRAALTAQLVAYFPDRRHLGTLVYNPTTTWLTLQFERLVGLKALHLQYFKELQQRYLDKLQDPAFVAPTRHIPWLPPLPVEYCNSLIEVKVPHRFLRDRGAYGATQRQLWGGAGGIYTDDSDLLAVLQHLGALDGAADLSAWNDGWRREAVPTDGDLAVTLLVLPPLEEYRGDYAHGVHPRAWTHARRAHNGLSFAVYDIRRQPLNAFLADPHLYKAALRERLTDRVE